MTGLCHLLRRSNPSGNEIRNRTENKNDLGIPLPPALMRALREHVAALPPGPMKDSVYLFPSTTGGMRSRSALNQPFRAVVKALGWTIKLTPKCMRRTFNDLARRAAVHDIVLRSISTGLSGCADFRLEVLLAYAAGLRRLERQERHRRAVAIPRTRRAEARIDSGGIHPVRIRFP